MKDAALCAAAREIEQGLYEADLGQGVCKKRIAIPGKGKSGSTRTLVATRHAAAIIFMVGREKNESGSDFSDATVETARIIAAGFNKLTVEQMDDNVSTGQLMEICNAEENQ